MLFLEDNNLINASGTKNICCQIMALKFVNIHSFLFGKQTHTKTANKQDKINKQTHK